MSTTDDILAIQHLVARWCDAINRRDFAAAAACFATDGVWAPPGSEARGRAEIEALLEQLVGPQELLVQFAANPLIDLRGDSASARWQVLEVGRTPDGKNLTILGTYDDRLTRTAGEWQFLERRFSLLMFATHEGDAMVHPFG